MARRRKLLRSNIARRLRSRVGETLDAVLGRARLIANIVILGALVAGGYLGLGRLDAHVRSLPEYQSPVRVELANRPDWMREHHVREILAGPTGLEFLAGLEFLDDRTVERVASHTAQSGWVARVVRAEKLDGGVVRVECEFREPIAVVQRGSRFYLVDAEGLRLPGTYSDPGGYLIVQGVGQSAPPPGRSWNSDDLQAGLRLAELVLNEPFADQIGSIQVHNYAGRRDPAGAHLALLTRPADGRSGWGRVLWGSGPGEEIEEPTADEKIRLLRANYMQCGRIDAGAPWIDVSIRPGEYRRPIGEQSGVS